MSETRKAAQTFRPSVFIEDELKARKWTLWDLVRAGGSKDEPLDVVAFEFYLGLPNEPDLLLGQDGCVLLSKAFGTSSEYWQNLENTYRASLPKPPVTTRSEMENGG